MISLAAEKSKPARLESAASRRSLSFLLAGAMLGLVLAGYSLFTSAPSTREQVPDDAAALVNGQSILKRDFGPQAETQYGKPEASLTPQERQTVLQAMIDEELLVQRGIELEIYKSDPDARQAIVNAVNAIAAAEIEASQPSESELKSYLESHRSEFILPGTVHVHRLIVPAETGTPAQVLSRASSVVQKLRAHLSEEEVALVTTSEKLHELDPSPSGSELTESAAERLLGRDLWSKLLALGNAGVLDPFTVGEGSEIVVLTHRGPARELRFEEVRPRLQREVQQEAIAASEIQKLKLLHERGTIVISKDFRR